MSHIKLLIGISLALCGWIHASTVRICGSVVVPPGVSPAAGEITVSVTRERVYLFTTDTDTKTATLGGANLSYCLEHNNDHSSLVNYHKYRVKVSKTTATVEDIYTGNLKLENATGVPTERMKYGIDYYAQVDARYLGSADPLPKKLSFIGLKAHVTAGDGQNLASVPNVSAQAGKVISLGFFNGNLVPNFSFENGFSNWTAALPQVQNMSHNAVSGSSSAGIEMPSVNWFDLISRPFPAQNGSQYTFGFSYQAYNVTGDVRPVLRCYENRNDESSAPVFTDFGNPYVNNGKWTRVVKTVTLSNPEINFCTVTLLAHSATLSGGGRFLFDDVLFESGSVANSDKIGVTTSYFDGLNRNIQTVINDGNRDLITQTEYDPMGRAILTTLPIGYDYFRHNGRHAYLEGMVSGATGGHLGYFYGEPTEPFPKSQGYAFTEIVYDQSPLGRVVEKKLPGGAWRTGSHSRKMIYGSTDALVPTGGNDQEPLPNLHPHYSYTLTQDEEGHFSREFRDEFGRLRKSGSKIGSAWSDVELSYDDFGNVTYRLGPQGPVDRDATHWTYNSLNQELWESSSDIGEIRKIYDKAGRLRFSQSFEQRTNSGFTYFKYDALNRMIESGEYLDNEYFSAADADLPDFPVKGDRFAYPKVFHFFDQLPKRMPYCQNMAGEGEIYLVKDDPGSGEYATLKSAYDAAVARLATLSSFSGSVQIYQVFNDAAHKIFPPAGTQFKAIPLGTTGTTVTVKFIGLLKTGPQYADFFGAQLPFSVAWGPMKGRLMKTLTCNDDFGNYHEVSKTFNYDKYGNATDIFEYNGYLPTSALAWDRAHFTFDINNRLIEKKVYSNKNVQDNGSNPAPVIHRFTYDHLGRTDEVKDRNAVRVAKYTYDNLGKISSVELGTGANMVRISYSYDFHGWMTKLDALRPSDSKKLYSEVISYENGGTPKFNGSISKNWYQLVDDKARIFEFRYDDLNRLIAADFPVQDAPVNNPGKPLNLSNYLTYYDNGSMKTQKRAGANYTDAVVYGYHDFSNKLMLISKKIDGRPDYQRDMSGYFNFDYDRDGRMTKDYSMGLVVDYDIRDLPVSMTWKTNGKSYFAYDEGGRRVSKMNFVNGVASSSTHYFNSGKEARGLDQNFKEIFSIDGFGRFIPNATGGGDNEFYIRNHHGNTVVVYNSTSGQVVYSADYFPFGLLANEYVTPVEKVTPKYTGKETDSETGLEYFGARYYDPDAAVWITPDPARQHFNPYTFAGNDPINRVDPDGRYDMIHFPDGHVEIRNPEVPGRSDFTHIGTIWAPGLETVEGPVAFFASLKAIGGIASLIRQLPALAKALVKRSGDFAKAADALGDGLAKVAGKSNSKKPATMIGGVDPAGRTAVGRSVAGKNGCCAEMDVAGQLGGDPKGIIFTKPVRPRTGEIIPVCTNCQKVFDPSQFPPGTPFQGPNPLP